MRTQTKKETNLSIANDDWSVLNGIGAEDTRFQIKPKVINKKVNTEDMIQSLANVAETDDEIIRKNTTADENATKIVIKKITKPPVTKKTTPVKKETKVTKPVSTRVQKTTLKNQVVSKVNEKEEVAQKSIASVNPQTTTVAASSETKATVKEVSVVSKIEAVQSFLKFILMGFIHLYVKKTNSVLKPLEFIAKNSYNVGSALLHLVVPMVMTWFATTQINAVVTRIATEGTLLTSIYIGAFYLASIFIWISGLVVAYGILSVIRTSLQDVAKVGKDSK